MKNFLANSALVGAALLWIIGVDFMPFMKVLGFPLFIGAFAFWVKYSDTFKKFCKFIDEGYAGGIAGGRTPWGIEGKEED